jgi:hypothetical protein
MRDHSTDKESTALPGLMPFANVRGTLFAVALLLAILLPFAVKNFYVFQLTLAMVYAIAILGLNLLTGFNGQFSLGHSAFFAIGAYTAAIMIEHFGIAYYWTLPVAGVVCLISGYLFGLPASRLEGIYLALATFSLAIARRLDRGGTRHRHHQARCAIRPAIVIRSMAVLFHARGARRAVCVRGQSPG